MPDTLPLHVIPLFVILGVIGFIALNQLSLWSGARGEHFHPWVAAWCAVAAAFIIARLGQRLDIGEDAAALGTRVSFACGALVGPIAAGALHHAARLPASRVVAGAGALLAILMVGATLFTPWVVTNEAYLRTDWSGSSYPAMRSGRGALLFVPYGLAFGAYCVWVVRNSRSDVDPKMPVWYLLTGFLVATGINDILMSRGVIRSMHMLEYGYCVMTIGISWLDMRWHDRGFANLEDAVRSRTEKLTKKERRLKRALADLSASEARLQQLSAAALEGLVVHQDGRIVDINAALARLVGRPREELIGREVLSLFETSTRKNVLPLLSTSKQLSEARLQGPDARLIAVEVVGTKGDADGTPSVLAIQDVSDRKGMQAKLILSDRMASIGTLAAGTAHEINNPLSYVNSNLQLAHELLAELQRERPEPRLDSSMAMLDESFDGVQRIRRIVDDLNSFASVDKGLEHPTDVIESLEKALKIVDNEIRHRAQVVRRYASSPAVRANSSRLGQVFINLFVNAAHSIPEGDAEHNELRVSVESLPGDRVLIEVSDTGRGVAPEILDRIFDPFVTTKAPGEGSGLGLSIVHGIVTSLGGEISVSSELGAGTTFRVLLPSCAAMQPSAPKSETRAALQLEPRKILVVDDEPLVSRSTSRALAPHKVTIASSGREAVALCEHDQFDLVLCDVMMPDLSGPQVYEELAKRSPGMQHRVLFMTGGAFTAAARQFLDRVPNKCIAKPLDVNQLRSLVGELLSEWDGERSD